MANDVTVDATEMVRFAADLGRVASTLLPKIDAVAKRGAENIKGEMASDAAGSRHFRGIAQTIDYDRDYGLGYVGYEVGPNRERGGQAPLAGVAYFGGANGGGGTLDIDGPLEREAPKFMKALDELLGDL